MSEVIVGSNCTNCETSLLGSYCHNCGRKHLARKTGFVDVLNALLAGVLSLERSLPGTMLAMIMHPAKVVNSYWSGSRGHFLSPAQMIFFTIFILGLHIAFIHERILGLNVNVAGVEGGVTLLINPQLVFFVMILPLFTLSAWLAYFKKKITFPEHFIGCVYVFAFSVIICTVGSDIFYAFTGKEYGYTTFIFFALMYATGTRVFSQKEKLTKMALMFLLQIITFALIVTLIVYVLYLMDPESIYL